MKVGSFQVTYCTNVHPGETLGDLHRILTTDVRAVKNRLSPTDSLGAGLRLGNQVTNELLDTPGALTDLVERCQSENFSVFTVNGFPYGDFAADTIKAEVYKPAWYREDRVRYTERLARVLAALPGPTNRTISTVAGGFLPDTADEAMKTLIARNLRRSAEDLARIADETGVHIRLCLEPEPWTMLETTRDAVEFLSRICLKPFRTYESIWAFVMTVAIRRFISKMLDARSLNSLTRALRSEKFRYQAPCISTNQASRSTVRLWVALPSLVSSIRSLPIGTARSSNVSTCLNWRILLPNFWMRMRGVVTSMSRSGGKAMGL